MVNFFLWKWWISWFLRWIQMFLKYCIHLKFTTFRNIFQIYTIFLKYIKKESRKKSPGSNLKFLSNIWFLLILENIKNLILKFTKKVVNLRKKIIFGWIQYSQENWRVCQKMQNFGIFSGIATFSVIYWKMANLKEFKKNIKKHKSPEKIIPIKFPPYMRHLSFSFF